jgi:hypothetical protein
MPLLQIIQNIFLVAQKLNLFQVLEFFTVESQ